MEQNEMIGKIKDDSIINEELYDGLTSRDFNTVGLSLYKIIERKFCDHNIIMALTKISLLLNGYRVAGPYQIGHLAIAALALVNDKSALECYEQIYRNLNENDKFLVDNYVKGMKEVK